MEMCKDSYTNYTKCMDKNSLKHHKNTIYKYVYCGKDYSNFLKCLNSVTDIKLKNSKCSHLKK